MGGRHGFRGPHTEETKAKIAAAKRGRTHSPETKAKMSAMRRGRKIGPRGPLSLEARAKVSAALKGVPKSEAHRAATSKAVRASEAFRQAQLKASQKAHDARRGQPISEEHKRRISAANSGISWYVASAGTRAKMSRSQRESPICIEKRSRIGGRRPTSLEKSIEAVLVAIGVSFESQKKIGHYRADFFVPSLNLVIECDGAYWHERHADRDAVRDGVLTSLGYRVLRLPEASILSGAAAQELTAVLSMAM